MIPLPSFKGLLGKGPSGFDPDYQAILNRGTALGYTLPDVVTQSAGNALVVALKASGVWAELDILYLTATTGDSNFATLNWKDPLSYQLTLFNSPTFRSKFGFRGNGTTSYISTNWNPVTNGVQYTQDNASRFVFVTTQTIPASTAQAALDGNTTAAVNAIRGTESVSNRINSVTAIPSNADYQGTGVKLINRPNASTVITFSGSYQQTFASTSVAMTSASQFIGRSGGGYNTGEVGAYGCGSDLTALAPQLLSAIKSYFTAMTTSFDSDYQAVINRATTLGYSLPSSYMQCIQNDIVVKLKASGLWNKLDILYQFQNDASTADFATLNWKDPNNFQATLVNSPVWVSEQGIQLNGTTQYIDTNFIPSTHAVQYQQDNACVQIRADSVTSGNFFGTSGGATGLLQHIATNSAQSYLNSTNPLSTTPSSSSGQTGRALVRNTSTDTLFRGVTNAMTSTATSRTSTSTGLPTTSVWIGRSGTTTGQGTYRFFTLGSALTDAELFNLHSIQLGTLRTV